MTTFQASGKVTVEMDELIRWRMSGPTAGRQLLIAMIGMPSTPTGLEALSRLTVKTRSGSVTLWGENTLAHTLYTAVGQHHRRRCLERLAAPPQPHEVLHQLVELANAQGGPIGWRRTSGASRSEVCSVLLKSAPKAFCISVQRLS